jgi:hypothetical protein
MLKSVSFVDPALYESGCHHNRRKGSSRFENRITEWNYTYLPIRYRGRNRSRISARAIQVERENNDSAWLCEVRWQLTVNMIGHLGLSGKE